jgi:hypothetical protein
MMPHCRFHFQWRVIPSQWRVIPIPVMRDFHSHCLRYWVISEWRSTSEQLLSWLLRCFKMRRDLSWYIWELASAEHEGTTTRFERHSALHWPSLSEQWVAPWNAFFSEYQIRCQFQVRREYLLMWGKSSCTNFQSTPTSQLQDTNCKACQRIW